MRRYFEFPLFNYKTGRVLLQNNLKNLDPSYKIELGHLDCFGGEKLFSHLYINKIGSQLI